MRSPLLRPLLLHGVQRVSETSGNHSSKLLLGRRTQKAAALWLGPLPFGNQARWPFIHSFSGDLLSTYHVPYACWAPGRSTVSQVPALTKPRGVRWAADGKPMGTMMPVGNAAIPLLGTPKRYENICPCVHTKTCTQMFVAALVLRGENWKNGTSVHGVQLGVKTE